MVTTSSYAGNLDIINCAALEAKTMRPSLRRHIERWLYANSIWITAEFCASYIERYYRVCDIELGHGMDWVEEVCILVFLGPFFGYPDRKEMIYQV